jgi:hypothetical protein
MRNRAKCRLCGDVIESLHVHDYVPCKCDEIAVDGGTQYWRVFAKSWDNFIRLDDEGNEVIPVVEDKIEAQKPAIEEPKPLTREDKLVMLEAFAQSIERLPEHALMSPVSHADLYQAILLMTSILRAKE